MLREFWILSKSHFFLDHSFYLNSFTLSPILISHLNILLNKPYQKLLLLKDKMNTTTGQAIAQHRHQFMQHYLKEFYQEWNGEC